MKSKTSPRGMRMKRLASIIGIFILSFGFSIIMCCVLPPGALVFVEAILLIAAGVFYVMTILC